MGPIIATVIVWAMVAFVPIGFLVLAFGPRPKRTGGGFGPGECQTCGYALWTLGEGLTHCPACNSVV